MNQQHPTTFTRVPFNTNWISHDKLDLKGIYRRPRFVPDKYGDMVRELDAQGIPTWDVTGALPIRHHNKWAGRGFQFITLASTEDLMMAARYGTIPAPAATYVNHRTTGPWNAILYLEVSAREDADAMRELAELVTRHGSAAVESIKRQGDATFELPESLRGFEPGAYRGPEGDMIGAADPVDDVPPPGFVSMADVQKMIADALEGAAAVKAAAAAAKVKPGRKAKP